MFLRPCPQPPAPKPAPAGRLLYGGDILQRRVTSTFLAHFPHPKLPPTRFSRGRNELAEAAMGEGRSPARGACALGGGRAASLLLALQCGGILIFACPHLGGAGPSRAAPTRRLLPAPGDYRGLRDWKWDAHPFAVTPRDGDSPSCCTLLRIHRKALIHISTFAGERACCEGEVQSSRKSGAARVVLFDLGSNPAHP